MKSYRELQEEIKALAPYAGLNMRGTPDVHYTSTYTLAQYGFGATEIQVTSAVAPARRGARRLSTIIKSSMSRDQILAKLADFKGRVDKQLQANVRLRDEAQTRAAAAAAEYTRLETEWKGLIAAAFNDGPPKVITQYIVDYGHRHTNYKVSLPGDLDKRAEFLRKLDDLLATYED
jgi:hypothetical protein